MFFYFCQYRNKRTSFENETREIFFIGYVRESKKYDNQPKNRRKGKVARTCVNNR